MRVSNFRYDLDLQTYEQNAVVDVSVNYQTLYDLRCMDKELRDEILLAIGKEIIDRIIEMRKENDFQSR